MTLSIGWLRQAPDGTVVPVAAVLELLDSEDSRRAPSAATPAPSLPTAWPDLLWLVPAERRMGTREVVEAIGRSRSWLYAHLSGPAAIPHAKLDGELVFTAGKVRAWLRDTERVVVDGPMESTAGERRLSIGRAS